MRPGERDVMKDYRRFLLVLHEQLVDAIADAENMQWHHLNADTNEFKHYMRLITWQEEINERMVYYATAKARSAWKRLRKSLRNAQD